WRCRCLMGPPGSRLRSDGVDLMGVIASPWRLADLRAVFVPTPLPNAREIVVGFNRELPAGHAEVPPINRSGNVVGRHTTYQLQHSFAGPSAPRFCTCQIELLGENHHESTNLYDNGTARFGGCHRVTTGWARAEQSMAGDVEAQSREIDLS